MDSLIKFNLISSTFKISILSTIPSDNVDHKVSINVTSLKEFLPYSIVSKGDAKAFAKILQKTPQNILFLKI